MRLEEIMRAVCADFETELVEFTGEGEHVHLLVNFPPKAALSKLVNSLKGVSSPSCVSTSNSRTGRVRALARTPVAPVSRPQRGRRGDGRQRPTTCGRADRRGSG
ncbi:transposase [Micromonospora sp. ATA51]|uniref:transposase n=1 Tax=Micromonospora sp. ATA51 TaxID=2806098 RepID=UPI0035CBA501